MFPSWQENESCGVCTIRANMGHKMTRQRITGESIPGRFPPGTKARLLKVRRTGESMADLFRRAVNCFCERREAKQADAVVCKSRNGSKPKRTRRTRRVSKSERLK